MSRAQAIDATLAFASMPPEGEARELARAAAYVELFGSQLGRCVLRDILNEAGVGRLFEPRALTGNREYEIGVHDGALKIMGLAGFKPADLVANITDGEEGYFDDRHDFDD